MAPDKSIQVDDGDFTRLHNTILDKLALARFTASEYRCLMFLFRKTYGWQKKEDAISLAQWVVGVGLAKSERGNIHQVLRGLITKRVIYAKSNGNNRVATYGFNKHWEQWDASLFGKTAMSQHNSENETVMSEDNTAAMSGHSKTAMSQHNHKRKKETIKEIQISADAPVAAKPKDHLAVLAYRELHERYPTKAQMKIIAERDPPLSDWVRAIRQWAANGYNPRNIDRMLEWAFNPSLITERIYPNGAKRGANQGNTQSHDEPEYDPERQRKFDEFRAKRKADGSLYYR